VLPVLYPPKLSILTNQASTGLEGEAGLPFDQIRFNYG